jgi:type II secretory pathway pseudopilin PulG
MRNPNMKELTERPPATGEAGFTLVETLVAVVVLIFGLMAVTNLMLVAASSNTVANQGTAAVASAGRAMERLKAVTFVTTPPAATGLSDLTGGIAFATGDGGKDCSDPTLAFNEWHCNEPVPGVGLIHTHWWITATADPRLLYIRVRSEGTGAIAGARSRAEFTSFRSCTNADPATGGCPVAP